MKKDEDKLINLSYLESISDGNDDFILELIDMFFEQVPEYQKKLQLFFKEKDWDNLSRIAHKAKSAILMVGMDKLATDLKKLEENAKDEKNIHEYQEIITKFVNQSMLAINELKSIRKKIT
ncbi:MAG: Hpt domain-containing protein [Thiohalospira sp.]